MNAVTDKFLSSPGNLGNMKVLKIKHTDNLCMARALSVAQPVLDMEKKLTWTTSLGRRTSDPADEEVDQGRETEETGFYTWWRSGIWEDKQKIVQTLKQGI